MAACAMLVHVVLLLLSTTTLQAQDVPWPYNLPPHMKYYPEDEARVRRDVEIAQRLVEQQPLYVKKMSGDPNEKFFLDFWCFNEDNMPSDEWRNQTILARFGNALPLHSRADLHHYGRRSVLEPRQKDLKRDFGCPADTSACSSINRPNTCCPNGSTCQLVPDNGLGDVGCCEASQACAGSLSQCPQGYTSCPSNPGGGCCLPGFACFNEGCVQTSTTVVVVVPTTTTTIPPTTQPPSTTTPVLSTCSAGYRSCPASLGGGCCSTDRACGPNTCSEISTSISLTAPLRPTTDSTTSPPTTSSVSFAGCPTGFYACSAYHQGGCCQVGRDCASTSCPTTASVTVVNTNGITAIAPVGTSGPADGSCANGWSSCAADVGGGCCPTGYACGTASCSASASGGAGNQVSKETSRSGSSKTGSSATTLMTLFLTNCSLIILAVCIY